MSVRAWVSTSVHARGAIACVEVSGGDIAEVCAHAGVSLPRVGAMGLRDLAGIDEGVVVRWAADRATLMCHGSPAIARSLAERLDGDGVAESPVERFPEASSVAEACALDAVSRASSPRAVDVLLGQAALWDRGVDGMVDGATAEALARLIEAPMVVAVGRANVGKSTLLNALAARSVAVVSSEAGTTRDGVTAMLELDGLAVRWVDTPGVREGAGAVERRGAERAWALVERADLVVHCADAHSGWLGGLAVGSDRELRCATRCDLAPVSGAHLGTAAGADVGHDDGVAALARAVRERLVPDSALRAGARDRWVFHPSLARGGGGA